MADNPWLTGASSSGGEGGNPWLTSPGKILDLTGASSATNAAQKGGGLFGTLKRIPGDVARDLYHGAINTPAGVAELGGAITDDIYNRVRHPTDLHRHYKIDDLVKGYGTQLNEIRKHPLRHPGDTLLTVLPFASGAARLGLAAKASATGVPLAEARTLTVGDLSVHPELSRSGLGQLTQLGYDSLLQKAAARNPGGRAETRLNKKVGKTLAANTRMREQIAKGPGQALQALGRKLSDGEQKALQVVAEEAPLSGRIAAAQARVAGARDAAEMERHQAELDLLHEAAPYLTEKNGLPALTDRNLASVYGRMAKVAGDRETLFQSLGLLTDEAIQNRTTLAGRVSLGQPTETLLPNELRASVGATPLFEASQDAVRIPDVATRKGVKALNAGAKMGQQGTVGKLKAPGSITHEYTGVLRENAVRRQDTTALVAESSLEAAKFAGLKYLHDQVRKAVSPVPRRHDDLAVRLDNLGTSERMPPEARKFLSDPEEFFKKATPQEAGSVFDKIKAATFIDTKTMSPADRAAFAQLEAEGKVGWVPRKMLGSLAEPSAPLSASAGKGAVGTFDAVNNAERAAILYLKPAYAVPNLLGNAALNLIQQGFAAPRNLATAARLDKRLGPEAAARIDAAMGEGFAMSLSAHNAGIGAALVDKAARFWSKGVDVPFRRASFLHEAHRAGYRTDAQIKRLLTHDGEIDRLTDVSLKANREIIDYANLNRVEREIVRRVIFFYPWVKGATVYTGRMLREHPIASGVLGVLGQHGYDQYKRDFPFAPSYFEGSIKAGNRVINPAAASIFGTPAQVGRAITDVATGRISDAGRSGGFMTPALALEEAIRTRTDAGSGYEYPVGASPLKIAQDQLINGLPQVSLYRGLRGQSRSDNPLYPPSKEGAAGKFGVGGLYPQNYDAYQLRLRWLKEQQRLGR